MATKLKIASSNDTAKQIGITIESGVPIPPRAEGTGVTAAMKKMKPGDSICVPKEWATSAYTTAKRIDIGISLRPEAGKKGFTRIWRTR